MMDTFTMAEVAAHTRRHDCWVVVAGQVLDVTPFLDEHPGGARAMLHLAGTDATEIFKEVHWPPADYVERLMRFRVGVLASSAAATLERVLGQRPSGHPAPLENFKLRQLDTPFPASRAQQHAARTMRTMPHLLSFTN